MLACKVTDFMVSMKSASPCVLPVWRFHLDNSILDHTPRPVTDPRDWDRGSHRCSTIQPSTHLSASQAQGPDSSTCKCSIMQY